VPVDFIEIRPGAGAACTGDLECDRVRRRLADRAPDFLTFSAGFCTEGQLAYNNVGASFEYRLSQQWRFQTSFEPTSTCQANQASNPLTNNERYQAGLDFLWDREF
jgi:hypothetical protein